MQTTAAFRVARPSSEPTVFEWMQRIFGRPSAPESTAARFLSKGEVRSVRVPAGASVACQSGRLWLTANGSKDDVVLEAGDDWSFVQTAGVVVQALLPSVFRVDRTG